MSLTQDTTIRYQSAPDGYNFTWKLSKTLDQLSADDIKSQDAFVGFTSFAVNQLSEGALGQGVPENNPNHCYMWATTGSSYRWDGWDTAHWSTPANFPDGVYMRNVLVNRPLNKGGNTSLTKALNDVRIVLDVEPDVNTNIQKLAYTEGKNGPFISCWWNNDESAENRLTDYRYISPAIIIIVNDVLYLWTYGGLYWGSSYVNNNTLNQGYNTGFTNFDNTPSYHSLSMGWTMGYPVKDNILKNVVQDDIYGNGHIDNVDYNGYSGKLNLYLAASNSQKRMSIGLVDTTENGDIVQMYRAFSGFRWKVNNVWYKPIISGGVVTGYTDDMTVKSEWDNWTTAKGHNVPASGGGGGGIKDKEHEMPLAYIGGSAGMVTFYEINKTGLASADDISEAVSRFDIAQIGKDLLRNFISFKAFAAINTTDTVDRQIKIAGVPLEDSGGNALTGRVIGGVKPIDLFATSGGVTIPTLYNDYRDYEPYTKIQMYVPFCGWFDLPSWCIGKKITGTMFTDMYNGTVKAVIKASDTVVAEVGGCCAYDIPFVADATGMKAGAVISSALTTAAAVGGTVAMPNIATGIAAVSSAANLAATLNSNATTLKGVLGDGSNLNGLLHVYIKVSRPMSPNGLTNIPDSYKHEIGVPTMKEIKISAGDGYIQVMDAKVTGNMTAREKQMIIDGFRHGLNF